MTIEHHPGDETLLLYAAGTLGAGPALVVAAHLEACAVCRSRAGDFECIGGMLVEGMAREPLNEGGLSRAFDELAVSARVAAPKRLAPLHHIEPAIELPSCLQACEIGPWRWLGPGFRWSRITIAGSPDAKVML